MHSHGVLQPRLVHETKWTSTERSVGRLRIFFCTEYHIVRLIGGWERRRGLSGGCTNPFMLCRVRTT